MRWLSIVAVMALSGCVSIGGRDAGAPEPCVASARIVVVEAVKLARHVPSVTFEVVDDQRAFVTLLEDPDYYAGGIFDGFVHASVQVIEGESDPRPTFTDESGRIQPSPDYSVRSFGAVGESRFIDRPPGAYRAWTGGDPRLKCSRAQSDLGQRLRTRGCARVDK